MHLNRLMILAAGLAAAGSAASAATIVSYLDNSFTTGSTSIGGTTYASVAASYSDANVSVSDFINRVATSTGATPNAGISSAVGTAFAKSSVVPGGGGTASATPWMTFSVTAASGYEMSLSSLTFNFGGSNTTGGTVNYTPSYTVLYSFDNFATAGVSAGAGNQAFSLASGATNVSGAASVSLATVGGGALAAGQTVYFQIKLGDATNNSSVIYRLDNVALTGTVSAVAVPEPSAAALVLGVAALGSVGLRRRRRRA